jgi:hypothetical protein
MAMSLPSSNDVVAIDSDWTNLFRIMKLPVVERKSGDFSLSNKRGHSITPCCTAVSLIGQKSLRTVLIECGLWPVQLPYWKS